MESTELEPIETKRYLGLVPDLDFDEYRRAPGMNNSLLKVFHVSPEKYITEKNHRRPTTKAFHIGHAFHCLVCEPDKFKELYIKSNYNNWQTKESKLWRSIVQARGKFVLGISPGADPFWNPSEWDTVHRMAESVLKDPIASILLQGQFELSGFWVDKKSIDYEGTGKLCKLRMDIYNKAHSCIVDLKSAEDASMSGFGQACNNFGYYRQHPWYMTGAQSPEINLDVKNGFFFVVCEKEPPWSVAIYKLDPEWTRVGAIMLQHDMLAFKECHEKKEWPGYGWRGDDPVRDLVMPAYAKYHKIS